LRVIERDFRLAVGDHDGGRRQRGREFQFVRDDDFVGWSFTAVNIAGQATGVLTHTARRVAEASGGGVLGERGGERAKRDYCDSEKSDTCVHGFLR
jgi:hypothetical protein